MKFAVGYQYFDPGEESLVDIVQDYAGSVEEVFFAWLDQPSARSPAASASGLDGREGEERLVADLLRLKALGVKLDLLFNANCYGEGSLSRELAETVRSTVARLLDKVGLDVVTTTSLLVAEVMGRQFPELEVRASVNMRLGTIDALEQVRDIFDGFYLQREYNRDLKRLGEVRAWCAANGKKLCLLANSGCLNFCAAQTFHDNLVAHLEGINATKNIEGFNPILCQRHYANRANWPSILRNSSWIRPEDVRRYEGMVPLMKLATRTHPNPRQVVHAYASGKFGGNLLDLTEPGHGTRFGNHILDNTRFPADWFDRTSGCSGECAQCGYCASVLDSALMETEGLIQ